MRRIGRHLTYANVMSTLAVFLVVGGGTALAAYVVSSNSQIGPGTVSGHQPPTGKHANIISASVNGTDLAPGSVSAGKLAGDSVNSSKIANGQVQHGDLASTALTDGITTATTATATNTDTPKELTADCPAGTKVTGGGYVFGGQSASDDIIARRSYAVDADTWLVRAASVNGTTPNWQLTVVANCLG